MIIVSVGLFAALVVALVLTAITLFVAAIFYAMIFALVMLSAAAGLGVMTLLTGVVSNDSSAIMGGLVITIATAVPALVLYKVIRDPNYKPSK